VFDIAVGLAVLVVMFDCSVAPRPLHTPPWHAREGRATMGNKRGPPIKVPISTFLTKLTFIMWVSELPLMAFKARVGTALFHRSTRFLENQRSSTSSGKPSIKKFATSSFDIPQLIYFFGYDRFFPFRDVRGKLAVTDSKNEREGRADARPSRRLT
jgi:hypothetical protein